jgi:hypothetical protein
VSLSRSIAIAVRRPSASAPSVTLTRIGCRTAARWNSSARLNSNATGRPVRSTARRDEVLGEHLLLATESAPEAGRVHAHAVAVQAEDVRDLVARQKRHLRRGAQHQAAVVVEPADRAVGLQLRVRDPRGLPRPGHRHGARGQGGLELGGVGPGVHARDDVALRFVDAVGGRAVGMQQRPGRRASSGRRRREQLVVHGRAARSSAASAVSATTAATRPTWRTTSSSMRVSSGSSVRCSCRPVE